jgi:CheY-like chemotaxis protein
MGKALVFSNNPTIHQQVENSFAEYGYEFQLAKGIFEFCDFIKHQVQIEKENYDPVQYDILLLDASIFVKRNAFNWLDHFYECIEALEKEIQMDVLLDDIPVILIDASQDFTYIERVLKLGYVDYMYSKPFDSLLLIQKMNRYFSEGKVTKSLVDEMDISKDAQLSLQFEIIKISIFGVQLKAYQPIKNGAVVKLSLPFLLDESDDKETQAISDLICRSVKTERFENEPNTYRVFLQFLALNDHDRKVIRNWMNKEYARIKIKSLDAKVV